MNSHKFSSFRLSVALLLSVILVSACSGSSGPQTMIGPETVVEANTGSDNNAASVDDGDAVSDESIADTEGEPVDDMSSPSEVGSVNTDPVVSDPMVQNRTEVTFEIMVPMYQSDALQVRLIWGDTELTANWAGDEFWSAKTDLPTNTEHTLNVTFYDNNGDIELARSSQEYETGVNAAETLVVGVEQFDASLFDTDQDGVNNLDELIAGADPFIDEDSLLPIRDFITSTFIVSRDFESRLTEERPLFVTFEPEPGNPNSISGNLDIDAEGNGALTRDHGWGAQYANISGTRTHSENSVSWEGVRNAYDGNDYNHTTNFTNTVTLVDENTRGFVEETVVRNVGTNIFSWEISSNLTGRLIEGTSVCEPVAGTVFTMYFTNDNPRQRVETSVSRETDDPYWRVVRVTNFIDSENEIETTEHFARELRMVPSDDQEENGFICDFVDY